jgi:hypothetical protein
MEGGLMLFFLSEEDLKAQMEHDIVWNEKWIKSIEESVERNKESLKHTWNADTIKAIYDDIRMSEDAIKHHKQFDAKWRRDYEARYGCRYGVKVPQLMVIRGGNYQPLATVTDPTLSNG